MDNPKPPQQPAQLLNDLESIRELLGEGSLEPPVLMDSLDPDTIPLLSDIVTPAAKPIPGHHTVATPQTSAPIGAQLRSTLTNEVKHLDGELRAAAQLILQDVIDDFVPQIEAELKRRLEARLTRLLPPRKN
ncbi:DNA polymerase III subunit chi [Pseudomonas borbori]